MKFNNKKKLKVTGRNTTELVYPIISDEEGNKLGSPASAEVKLASSKKALQFKIGKYFGMGEVNNTPNGVKSFERKSFNPGTLSHTVANTRVDIADWVAKFYASHKKTTNCPDPMYSKKQADGSTVSFKALPDTAEGNVNYTFEFVDVPVYLSPVEANRNLLYTAERYAEYKTAREKQRANPKSAGVFSADKDKVEESVNEAGETVYLEESFYPTSHYKLNEWYAGVVVGSEITEGDVIADEEIFLVLSGANQSITYTTKINRQGNFSVAFTRYKDEVLKVITEAGNIARLKNARLDLSRVERIKLAGKDTIIGEASTDSDDVDFYIYRLTDLSFKRGVSTNTAKAVTAAVKAGIPEVKSSVAGEF